LVVADADLIVIFVQSCKLALRCIQFLVLLAKLSLELTDLICTALSAELLAFLSTSVGIALVHLDLLFQAEDVENHDVGAVENEGEEESEATKVHVTLRVELASLDLHTLGTHGCSSAGHVSVAFRADGPDLHRCAVALLRVCRHLNLNAVDTVDAIKEKDQNEDECNLAIPR
jgi:hypothetical protein